MGDGDHSSMACIPSQSRYSKIISKGRRNYCWCRICQNDIHYVDSNLTIDTFIADGMPVKYGDVVFYVSGSSQSLRKEWF
jgi:nicotinate-nucleotide pyrophosphorylase (carboxylating)